MKYFNWETFIGRRSEFEAEELLCPCFAKHAKLGGEHTQMDQNGYGRLGEFRKQSDYSSEMDLKSYH